jgi:hypothetical protein
VLNPVILSEWYDIPPSWLDPWESRPGIALLESKDRQQEIFLIPESPPSELTEFNTLQASPGNTEKFLEENLITEELGKETPTIEKFLEENSTTEESGKETPTTEKFLEENSTTEESGKETPTIEITHACGCLYQYIENKKLKNGLIVSYPRISGEREKHNYAHWRWGYSWEEKIGGDWKNRSVGVPNKIVHAVGNMINNGNTVQNIREFIALSKNSRKSNQ